MTTVELMARPIEKAGERELSRLYLAALTAQARGQDAIDLWNEFGRTLTRVLALQHLMGRVNAAATVGLRKLPPPPPFKTTEFAAYAEEEGILTKPFTAALNWFLDKVPNVRRVVDKMLPAAKAKAFWVTGVESTEALNRIKMKLAKPLAAEPGGLVEFAQSEQVATGLALARLETVYRTNVMSALNQGGMEQMTSPEIRPAVALIRFNAIHDTRTRGAGDNPGRHLQMDGFLESPDHQIWSRITPPGGYNCRCNTSPIGWLTAERMGLANDGHLLQSALDDHNRRQWEIINAREYPDSGFGGN